MVPSPDSILVLSWPLAFRLGCRSMAAAADLSPDPAVAVAAAPDAAGDAPPVDEDDEAS